MDQREAVSFSLPQPVASPARFARKVALVTGASDRGIGGAIAERLAEEGARLALVSRRKPARLMKKLQRLGAQAHWQSCDITQPQQVQAAVAETISVVGRLDVLINNAGVETACDLEQFPADEWRSVLNTNLLGAIEMTQAALPQLIAARGCVVNIASALALAGCPGYSIYSASKAGLVGLTQSLAWELAPRGVRVVAVAPALVHTPMVHKHRESATPATLDRIDACHPLGVGLPCDVAAAVAFLASDEARWITGITLPLGWAPQYPLPVEQFLAVQDAA
jgi:NAD(P)-dependent dehydrogenase (short-subunit alcohol dehydrogenase family)